MHPESREQIKTGEKTIEIADPNSDVGSETREYFADGSWRANGEIKSGKNAGMKWVKGHGGITEGDIDLRRLGVHANIEQTSTNDWGYMIEGGKEPGKPKTGDNWFKPVLHHETEVADGHDESELELREGVNQETDEQGRPIYEVKRYGEKVIVMRRTFHDDEGYVVETGKHVAGTERGKVWESRRPIVAYRTEAALMTPVGSLRDLEVRGVVIDRELSEAEAERMTPEQQAESRDRMRRAVTVDLRGARWEAVPEE